MSEENKGSAESKEKVSQETQQHVSRKAYEEVTQDMHKYKQKVKELEMAKNEFATQLKAQEEAKMQEQERWKELYEKTQAELEEEKNVARQKDVQIQRSVKLSALKQELGGNVKDQYLNFANLESISLREDGTIDSESLRSVANEFRNEHGQLIPVSQSANATGHAPSSADNFSKPKDITQMSVEEKMAAYAAIKNQK